MSDFGQLILVIRHQQNKSIEPEITGVDFNQTFIVITSSITLINDVLILTFFVQFSRIYDDANDNYLNYRNKHIKQLFSWQTGII